VKFGEVPLGEAEGAILAHSLRLADGALKKGRRLSGADLERLRAADMTGVVVARLEAGDVGEDPAAEFVATRLRGEGIRVGAAFTGRCNLFADAAGLLWVDAPAVDAINTVDESITVATAQANTVVKPRQMLATVKIIPFAVSGRYLDAVDAALADRAPVIRVAPFGIRRIGLVQTRLPGTREAVLEKTRRVLEMRVAGLGGRLWEEQRCAHDSGAVADAFSALLGAGAEMVLIAGASAIVDRRDVVPAAILAAGGEIEHFGMPMDPGNLILIARHGSVPVVGLPGCARSPKYNGIDEVLRRLAAGQEVKRETIASLGVGGLLKETPERPLPRAFSDTAPDAPKAPKVCAMVLAAGQSRRMGATNKLLLEVGGTPLIRRSVGAALESACEAVFVVTGHEAERVASALSNLDVAIVGCEDYASGLSASLSAGVAALPEDCDAVVVCLGDMPRVTSAHIDRLIAAFDPLEGRAVCVPTYQGKRGNPVLWDRRFFSELADIRGDVGARHLIGEHAELVCEVAMTEPGVLVDVDSPVAFKALTGGSTRHGAED
jgi:molybdenum cofactor cytidylyltransferase